jgi:hypothetical protein
MPLVKRLVPCVSATAVFFFASVFTIKTWSDGQVVEAWRRVEATVIERRMDKYGEEESQWTTEMELTYNIEGKS